MLLHEHDQLREEMEYRKAQGEAVDEDYVSSRIVNLETEASRQEKDALSTYGMLEGSDPRVCRVLEERCQGDWEAKKRRVFEELGSRVADGDRALSEMRGPAIGESTLAVSPSIQFMPKVDLLLVLSAQTFLSTCKLK
jgi:hypothetical protein